MGMGQVRCEHFRTDDHLPLRGQGKLVCWARFGDARRRGAKKAAVESSTTAAFGILFFFPRRVAWRCCQARGERSFKSGNQLKPASTSRTEVGSGITPASTVWSPTVALARYSAFPLT